MSWLLILSIFSYAFNVFLTQTRWTSFVKSCGGGRHMYGRWTCHSTSREVRGQLCEVDTLLPSTWLLLIQLRMPGFLSDMSMHSFLGWTWLGLWRNEAKTQMDTWTHRRNWNQEVWSLCWRSLNTLEAQCAHYIVLSRETELLHTVVKEALLLHTDRQGGKVYGVQQDQEDRFS